MYKLPEQLTTSSRAAGMSWNDEFADMPTPFRAQNFDLLQRACTREAIVRAVVLLNATSEHASSAAWLESRALEWLPRFGGASNPTPNSQPQSQAPHSNPHSSGCAGLRRRRARTWRASS